ncbi:MAG: type II toxin-antitoxin system VapC family toxin [Acidobacteriia bacterium]|nr:type II toxin-antitoxin system VapC family toxin [Terriglobia bacterium]
MIIDTSAMLAILFGEEEAEEFATLILAATEARVSAASYLAAGIRVDRLADPVLSRLLDDLVSQLRITIHPVTSEHARIAREAYRDFGKGSGHPAQLNFGDCLTYALAESSGEELLHKGRDFNKTGLRLVARSRPA